MAIIEGKWDCSHCSTAGIRGSVRNCPNCGQPRNENTVFYLGDSPRRLSDEEGAKHGVADWVCEYCGALNADSNTQCEGCGAAKSGVSYHDKHPERRGVLSVEVTRRPPSVERSATPTPLSSSSPTPSPHPSNPLSVVGNFAYRNKGMLYRILAIIAVLAVVGVGVWALWPKPQTGTVTGFRWTHTVEYEEYREVREEGWNIPIGGREVSSIAKIKEYKPVISHYETRIEHYTEQVFDHDERYVSGHRDLGNGFFEEVYDTRPVYRTEQRTRTYQVPVYRSEPVYANYYTYDIWRWQSAPEYTQVTNGDTRDTHWPVERNRDGLRTSFKSANYFVTIINAAGESHEYTCDESVWLSLEEGMGLTYRVFFGKLVPETPPN